MECKAGKQIIPCLLLPYFYKIHTIKEVVFQKGGKQ